MWLHFDLGETLDYPIFFSNPFVEFYFVRAHMTLAEMVCLVFHFICGIPPGGFIPITCTDSLSLMVLAWEDLRVSLFR